VRIAYLSTFYPFRGGIAQFNKSLYQALAQQGHEVKAFSFKRQYPALLFPGKSQFVAERDSSDEIMAARILDSINPISFKVTAKEISAFNPDVLLMKYWMSFLGYSLGNVAKRLKKTSKIITILDNVIPHEKRFFDSFLTKYFLKQNDCFVAMSDSVEKDLYTLMPHAKCLRIDHPLYDHFGEGIKQQEARNKLGVEAAKKTVLFFGIIRAYKGLDALIRAFDKLDDSYQLIIAGECYEDISTYKQLIEKSSAGNRIFLFDQYIADENVSTFFSAADVCVLPYRSATQSGIISISYHFNVPIIATDVGGLKESILFPNPTGLVVHSPDPELIAKAIVKFFSEHLGQMFKQNIQLLKENKSWSGFASSMIDFIKEID